jgi:hypothetical protein
VQYFRNDIYLCCCCLEFKDNETNEIVDVPYSEMPAELALELMTRRSGVLYRHPKMKQKKQHKGFRKM